jgi:hypothetical protein
MSDHNNDKINKCKEKIKILDLEKTIIYSKIEKLKKKLRRREMKKTKIKNKLLVICKHVWVPDIASYNVYDRPKYCKICGIDK